MVSVQGYKMVDYQKFQEQLHRSFSTCGKTNIDIASEVRVKTPVTVKNAFRTDKQIVSDDLLTAIMQSVGLGGFILWNKKERFYYIPKTN